MCGAKENVTEEHLLSVSGALDIGFHTDPRTRCGMGAVEIDFLRSPSSPEGRVDRTWPYCSALAMMVAVRREPVSVSALSPKHWPATIWPTGSPLTRISTLPSRIAKNSVPRSFCPKHKSAEHAR